MLVIWGGNSKSTFLLIFFFLLKDQEAQGYNLESFPSEVTPLHCASFVRLKEGLRREVRNSSEHDSDEWYTAPCNELQMPLSAPLPNTQPYKLSSY